MYIFNKADKELKINDKKLKLEFCGEDIAGLTTTIAQINSLLFSVDDYPQKLIIKVKSEDKFGTSIVNHLDLRKSKRGIIFKFGISYDNKDWKGYFGLSTFLATLHDVISQSSDAEVANIEIADSWKGLEIDMTASSDFIFSEQLKIFSERLNAFIKEAESVLTRVLWKPEHESDEKLFSLEIVYPLLLKMNFNDVRYRHGVREYGKDFTFSEITKFGITRNHALQVKAGNVKGNVNSDIDEIIGQLNDAFAMPYYEINIGEPRYISTFIIAISGSFTDNAKEKIIHKVPNYFKGSVSFLDRQKITELVQRY